MKKILLFFIALNLSLVVLSQTYCYQETLVVEKETGVKSKGSNRYRYITFLDEKRYCYFSNADGTTIEESSGYINRFDGYPDRKYEGRNYYVYQGVEDGLYVYMSEETTYNYITPNYNLGESGGYFPTSKQRIYLYFNSSFDRMNQWNDPKTYLVESSSSDSPQVKALRAGCAMGVSAGEKIARGGSTYISSFIYVYEKRSAATDPSENPVIFY